MSDTGWLVTFDDYDPVGVWLHRKEAVEYLEKECDAKMMKGHENIYNAEEGRYIITMVEIYGS